MKTLKLPSGIAILMLLGSLVALAQSTNNSAAAEAAAWKQVQQAAILPASPNGQPLPREQQMKFLADHFTTAAAKARAFYTQFPDSTNAVPAKMRECQMLRMAYIYSMDQDARISGFNAMAKAQDNLLKDPKLTDDQRFDLRLEIAQRVMQDPNVVDWKARDAAYENNLRQLIKDYPNNDKAYSALATYAAESSDDSARAIANEVLASPASDSTKDTARGILRRLGAVGKPLDIKFTALDGREVDLSQMKGKVVLVDFWATWCGPCVGEIPHVKETYDKLHSQGFEVVGISFDNDQTALKNFVSERDLPWPQYFDGKQWGNKFGVQYAIDSIPTMWLVDKKGNLRESNARGDLQGRVEKLLAE